MDLSSVVRLWKMYWIRMGCNGKMKECKKCGSSKAHSQFSKNKRNRDGLQSWCKACMAVEREKWNAANPDRRKELDRRWQERNPQKVRENALAWRNRNLERARQNSRDWKRNNLPRHAEHEQRRRARKVNSEVSRFPTLQELILVYGEQCMYPGCKRKELTVDHVVPLSIGGSHTWGNAQILCGFHNSQKGNRNSEDYRPKD